MTTAPDYTAAADASRREYLDSGNDTLNPDEMFAHVYAAGVARGRAEVLAACDLCKGSGQHASQTGDRMRPCKACTTARSIPVPGAGQ